MFKGNSQATVDAKGRLKIPAAFLADLAKAGKEFYVTSIVGDRAYVYPMKAWNELEEKLGRLPSQHPAKQKFLTRTSYYGQVVTLDKQGRLLIPQVLREAGQIKGEVDVMGSQTYLEVWNHVRLLESMQNNPIAPDDLTTLGI